MEVPLARVEEICAGFARQRIVVLGDVMLDHVIVGDARRISPEAPVPVVSFQEESHTAGGAANVARNLAALGGTVELLGVVGADPEAELLRRVLAASRISASGLVAEPGRPTTLKTRIVAHRQQIVRLDRETSRPLAPATGEALVQLSRAALPGAAAMIVADYAKGAIDQSLLGMLADTAGALKIPVCIDPKPGRHLALRGCAVLTPNRKEAFELAGLPDGGATADPATDPHLLQAAAAIMAQHGPAILLITLSEAGLLLVEPDHPPRHIPTFARQVFDVTGAGDTVIAAFVLAHAAGATPFEAATIANLAAGLVVAKTGTATVTVAEILDGLRHSAASR